MTVCTAALFQWNSGTSEAPDWGSAFIVAADRMLTDQGLGIEYEASRWKATIIKSTHMIFVAGDFTFLSEAISTLGRLLPDTPTMLTDDIARTLSDAFVTVRNDRLVRRYLSPYGLTLEMLVGKGIDAELAGRLQEELGRSQFEVEAIVVGIHERTAGLYRIDEFGVITNHLDIGFLSIGAGGIHASAQFMYEPYDHSKTHIQAVYSTFLAKKRSEVAPGVGSSTDIFRITKEAVAKIPDQLVGHMDGLYAQQRSAARRRYATSVESIEKRERQYFAELRAREEAAQTDNSK